MERTVLNRQVVSSNVRIDVLARASIHYIFVLTQAEIEATGAAEFFQRCSMAE